MSKQKVSRKARREVSSPDSGRRTFLALGLGGLGTLLTTCAVGYQAGWFDSAPAAAPAPPPGAAPSPPTGSSFQPISLSADYQNALLAADEIVEHYARALHNPSALIHAVRAFGKEFTLSDGTKAVDHLCAQYAAEKEVNGKRYIYFPYEVEVHENSFLKTFLEAGVSLDQPLTAGGRQYTLRDLGESAKSLFRCDPRNLFRHHPKLVHEHLPWGLIAFSLLVPPSRPTWTNAYGETINLAEVIDRGLAVFEHSCAGVHEALARGEAESISFRQEIMKYSCYGMHAVYGFFSCLQQGYRSHHLPERLRQMLDLVIYRLQGDAEAIDREAEAARELGPEVLNNLAMSQEGRVVSKGSPPPQIVEVMRLRSQIKLLGHAFEAINYVRLHRLFTLTAEQKRRVEAGERRLYESLVKMRAMDLEAFRRWYSKFVSDIVIAVAHAARGMKLLTPENPDTIAKN